MPSKNGVMLLTFDGRGLLARGVEDWALPGNIEIAVEGKH